MPLLEFILGLAALIVIHELGHFLAARFFKVPVEEFGIGFPPRLFGTARDKDGNRQWFGAKAPENIDPNDTIFSFNAIPLGGFVRPRGENDPDVPDGLSAAKPGVRLGVLFAGPAMNLIVGILLAMLLVYTYGMPATDKVLINYVDPESPAASAGLVAGDIVLRFDNQPVSSVSQLVEMINARRGQAVEIIILRDSQELRLTATPRLDPPENKGALGVVLGNPIEKVGIAGSMTYGFRQTYEYGRALLTLPMRLMSGEAQPQEGRLVGYKGMYEIYTGINNPIFFFMIISISLGLLNLMPIPALDGGRILLTLPELIIRRRVPIKLENFLNAAGFLLLIALLIYVNLQDFINPAVFPWDQ